MVCCVLVSACQDTRSVVSDKLERVECEGETMLQTFPGAVQHVLV